VTGPNTPQQDLERDTSTNTASMRDTSEYSEHSRAKPYRNYHYRTIHGGKSGPTGLMQGSPASNAILANLFKDMPLPDPELVFLGFYCDDIVILAKRCEDLDRVEQELAGYLGQAWLGPLTAHRKRTSYSTSFDFLGYEFSCADGGYKAVGEAWTIGLSAENFCRLMRAHEDGLCLDCAEGRRTSFHARSALRQFVQHYPAADLTHQWDLLVEDELYALSIGYVGPTRGGTWQDRAAAISRERRQQEEFARERQLLRMPQPRRRFSA
jgi:hypothetical protein